MLVKDLVILFQALNEGVINVLEHYFEMSHVDAESALAIYRKFCKQTDKVLEYLAVAKKLQNLLNVPVPALKHVRNSFRPCAICTLILAFLQAPVSLVSALEEYLNDPNFEQNRIEYKTNKASADKNARDGPSARTGKGKGSILSIFMSSISDDSKAAVDSSSARQTSPKPGQSSTATESKPPSEGNKAIIDFFSSIEEPSVVPASLVSLQFCNLYFSSDTVR